MPSNDGKGAESAFFNHWQAVGHIQRLRDKRDLMGINGGQRIADFAKPSDFLVSGFGVPLHYAEVKSTMNDRRFSFTDIRPAQSSAALREAAQGAQAYIFYIFSYPLGSWFLMPCVQYASAIAASQKSILFKDLNPWLK
jgi:hypothetical protein